MNEEQKWEAYAESNRLTLLPGEANGTLRQLRNSSPLPITVTVVERDAFLDSANA